MTGTNYMDIMSIPLIIKAPGQKRGVLSDRNVESVDILPTVMRCWESKPSGPWTDGRPWMPQHRNVPEKVIYSDQGGRLSLDSRLEARWSSLDRKLKLFGAAQEDLSEQDLFRIGPHAPAVKRAEPLVGGKSDLKVEIDGSHFFQRVDRDSPFLLSRISGRVLGNGSSRVGRSLAVGVNGTVRAVTRTTTLDREIIFSAWFRGSPFGTAATRFGSMKPTEGGHAFFSCPSKFPVPLPTGWRWPETEPLLVTPEGREIPVGDPGVTGWGPLRQSPGPKPDVHRRVGSRCGKLPSASGHRAGFETASSSTQAAPDDTEVMSKTLRKHRDRQERISVRIPDR